MHWRTWMSWGAVLLVICGCHSGGQKSYGQTELPRDPAAYSARQLSALSP